MAWLDKALLKAYYDARLNKRSTYNQLIFEIDYLQELYQLGEDIKKRRYVISPGIAFIVTKPATREIFAATFRDRVVHHLIYNEIADFWDRHFIYDSYSCRLGKGTDLGIARVAGFLRAATDNYRREAWVIKLDISGYFMHMNRQIMWALCQEGLKEQDLRPDIYSTLEYLLPLVIFYDPTVGVKLKGSADDWQILAKSKSLFWAEENSGFPIGNLTSQLFSNIYLHQLDQFVKYDLGFKYYGRYVDDFILIDQDKKRLLTAKEQIERFLREKMLLTLHQDKVYLQPARHGVTFLGARIKKGGVFPGKSDDEKLSASLTRKKTKGRNDRVLPRDDETVFLPVA